MRFSRQTVLTFIAVTFVSGALLAQSRPNFSATWGVDRDKTMALQAASGSSAGRMAGGGGGNMVSAGGGTVSAGGGTMAGGGGGTMMVGGAPPEMVVTQTAATITIERGPQRYTYKLDGSESINVNARTTMKTTSHWDGAKLVTEGAQSTTTDQGPINGTFREVRSLDKDGAMVIETARQLEGSAMSTSLQVLTKKK